eukprot:m.487014 g.487014  ORF g.487014 m.487014 type:complete len:78 (+) comp21749_c0_seq1:227-460(+)
MMGFPTSKSEIPLSIWMFLSTLIVWCLDRFVMPRVVVMVHKVWNMRLQKTIDVLVTGLHSTQAAIDNLVGIQDQSVQ